MTDPETKRKKSKRRMRNFIAKSLLQEPRFRKKIHEDEKLKQKERKWVYDEEDREGDYNTY